jgi:hypothetical protein
MFLDQSHEDPNSFKVKMMGVALQRLQGVGLEMEKRQERLDNLLVDIIGTIESLGSHQRAAVHQQIAMAVGPVLDSRLAASDHASRSRKCSPTIVDSEKNRHLTASLHHQIDNGVRRVQREERLHVIHNAAVQSGAGPDADLLEQEMNQEIEDFFCEGSYKAVKNDGFTVPCIVTSTEVLEERHQQAQDVIDRDINMSGAQGVLTSCDLAPCIMTTAERLGDAASGQNGVATHLSNCETMPFIVTTTEQIGECLQQASNVQHAPNSGLPHVQLARGDDVPCIVTTTEKLNECIEACSQNGVRVLPDAVPCIVTTAERLNESIQAASEALEDAHSQNTALSDGEIVIGDSVVVVS